jgi:hypothetical protein
MSGPDHAERPYPRAYFQPEGEGAGLLDWDELEPRLAAARNYWLVTASAEGRPHSMPVWGVWLDGRFLFSTDTTTRKARHIAENSRVVVHLEDAAAVILVEGTAAPVAPDSPDIRRFLDAYNPKYSWDFTVAAFADGGVYAVTPTTAFAWLGDQGEAFSGAATRWRFDA